MRIAIVSDYYLPSLGGAQTSIFNQKQALETAGHEVYLFVPKYPTSEPTDDKHTIRIPSLYVKGLDWPVILPTSKLVKKLAGYFKDLRIDTVHAQAELSLCRAALQAAHGLKIPVLYTVHTFSWKTDYFMPKTLAKLTQFGHRLMFGHKLRLIKRLPGESDMANTLKSFTFSMAQLSDHVICPSSHVAEEMRQAGATTPASVLPNPFMPAKPIKSPRLPKTVRIVWPSRCRPEKRIIEFIEACLIAQKTAKNEFFVDIVGDGPLLPAAKILAEGNKNIVFHGRVSAAKSVKLISNGSIVALSSYGFDNQPMIIAEAVSLNRGVLYCDKNLREGLAGAGYITSHTPKAIAAGITNLVDNPQKITKLSIAAKEDKRVFQPEYYSKNLLDIIKSTVTQVK